MQFSTQITDDEFGGLEAVFRRDELVERSAVGSFKRPEERVKLFFITFFFLLLGDFSVVFICFTLFLSLLSGVVLRGRSHGISYNFIYDLMRYDVWIFILFLF